LSQESFTIGHDLRPRRRVVLVASHLVANSHVEWVIQLAPSSKVNGAVLDDLAESAIVGLRAVGAELVKRVNVLVKSKMIRTHEALPCV
jgi:hypothetical protein